jgi:hypothetical protein
MRGHQFDHRALQQHHQVAHTQAIAAQVEQHVQHQLAGTVIGDLSAAIGLHDGNVAGGQHMAGIRCHAQRENGWMLQQPGLVFGGGIALVGEALHGLPGRQVVHAPEPADDHRPAGSPTLFPASACSAR